MKKKNYSILILTIFIVTGVIVTLNNLPAKWVFRNIYNKRTMDCIYVEIDRGTQGVSQSYVIKENSDFNEIQNLLASIQLSVLGINTGIEYCDFLSVLCRALCSYKPFLLWSPAPLCTCRCG